MMVLKSYGTVRPRQHEVVIKRRGIAFQQLYWQALHYGGFTTLEVSELENKVADLVKEILA